MSHVGWRKHALIFLALILNLWVGGDYIQLWLGAGARAVFEITLIFGYLTLIIGLRAPLPWRRPSPDEVDEEQGRTDRDAPVVRSAEGSVRETPASPPAVDPEHDPTRAL